MSPSAGGEMAALAMQRDRHVEIIDAVRGLAALSVAYLHCREISWIGMRAYWLQHPFDFSLSSIIAYATFPVSYGSIGVPILFVISGYVIHRRAARMLAVGDLHFVTSSFLIRRFIRIYPTFVAAIGLTYICDMITRAYGIHQRLGDLSLSTFFWNIVAFQGVFAVPFGSNGPLWSLAVEVQFYIVYPIVLLLRMRIGPEKMLATASGLSVAGYYIFERNGIVAFPQYYFSWWLGAYLADREARRDRLPSLWLLISALFMAAGCLCYSLQASFLSFMMWAIGFAPLLGFLIQRKHARLAPDSMLHRIGQFSYSIYAAHLPIVLMLNTMLFDGLKQQSIYWSLLMLLITLTFCYGFHLVAERPSLALLKKIAR